MLSSVLRCVPPTVEKAVRHLVSISLHSEHTGLLQRVSSPVQLSSLSTRRSHGTRAQVTLSFPLKFYGSSRSDLDSICNKNWLLLGAAGLARHLAQLPFDVRSFRLGNLGGLLILAEFLSNRGSRPDGRFA